MVSDLAAYRLIAYRTWQPPAPVVPAPVSPAPAWGRDRLPAFLVGAPPAAPPAPAPAAAGPIGKPFRFSADKQRDVYGAAGSTWLCGTRWDVQTIRRVATEARRDGTVPVFTQYAIPGRDNKGPSAGGAKDLASYEALVRANAAAIGDLPAVIVIEPDGLALGLNARCVAAAARIYRQACPNARIYVDAGHSSWKSPEDAARLLVQGGIGDADGFALNVSAFQWTTDNLRFGDRVRAALAKLDPRLAAKTYVVDTSRNGRGPGVDERGQPTWGDPVKALDGGPITNGPLPTWRTGHPGADAFLWVKGPGHGDGRIRPASSFGGEAWVKAERNPPVGP